MVEQHLQVAGTWVKCACESRQGPSFMRIAVPIWDDKVSPLLDTASKLLIIESETQKEVSRFEAFLLEKDIPRRYHFILGLNINVLICGGVSRQLSGMLTASEIKVISGISGPAEKVLDAYLQGVLLNSGFFMPGGKINHLDQSNTP